MKMRSKWPQGQSGCFGEEKDLLLLPEFERQFLGSAARSPGTILIELTRLFCTKVSGKNVLHKPFKKKKKAASSMLHEAKIAYYAFDAAILFASSIGPAVAKAT